MEKLELKRIVFLISFLALFSLQAFAIVENQQMTVLAVTNDGHGLGAQLFLKVEPGDGRVWVSAQPLVGTTTQNAAQVAVNLAKTYSREASKHDYKFSIESNASVVEGPSAGAAMALVAISSLQDKKVPSNISLTGTIDEAGRVGPVGGVFEKAKEAARLGIDLFMVPKGEAVQTIRENGQVKSINLVQYGQTELGMKIIEVSNIEEVLDYAFSDIEKIDISKIIENSEIPEFVPKEITYEPHLEPMKKLTNNFIEETKVIIQEAKNAAASTLVTDSDAISTLLEVITISEQLVKDADNLNAQNYLYSAANFAFLARVNALLVKDVAANPSLLSVDSSVLDLKINDLKADIASFEKTLEGNIPVEGLEWRISAQQRVSYAKLNLEKLSGTQTIVIGEEGMQVALSRVTEYEFAVAWLFVAKDFENIASGSSKFIKQGDEFKSLSGKLIDEATTEFSTLTGLSDAADIQRRLDAAKVESSKGWHIAAAVDAATAKALSKSEKETSGKTLEELKATLVQKISGLEEKISASKHTFSWPVLYVAHSKFFLEEADYYEKQSSLARASASLKSGVSLVSLANEIFETLEEVYTEYDSATTTSDSGKPPFTISFPVFPQDNGSKNGVAVPSSVLSSLPAIVLVLLIFSFGFAFLFFTVKVVAGPKPAFAFYSKEVESIKKMKLKADEALFRGVISKEKHDEIVANYEKELSSLQAIKKNHAQELLELEQLRQNISAIEKKFRDLKNHYKEGAVAEEDYLEKKQDLMQELEGLNKPLQKNMPAKQSQVQYPIVRQEQSLAQTRTQAWVSKQPVAKPAKPAPVQKDDTPPARPFAKKKKSISENKK